MKKHAIFGAGNIGKTVFDLIGEENVCCFVDNSKYGNAYLDKEIISFDQFRAAKDEMRLVVASFDFADEIRSQLDNNGIYDYAIWTQKLHERYCKFSGTYWDMLPLYCHNGEWFQYSLLRSFLNRDCSEYSSISVYCYGEIRSILEWLVKACGIEHKVKNYLTHGCDTEIKFRQIKNSVDCLITSVRRKDNEICALSEESETLSVVDLYDVVPLMPELHYPEVRQFHNAYKGKRCFVIGNGPSLRIDDLDTLNMNGEITFACNKIFLLFDNTDWRPDFYCISDVRVFECNPEEVLRLDAPVKIFTSTVLESRSFDRVHMTGKSYGVHYTMELCADNAPRFSSDISVQTFMGCTVSYDLVLQAAAYMGFEEIYLLGVDKTMTQSDKLGDVMHFCSNYFTDEEIECYANTNTQLSPNEIELAYKRAEAYSRKNGFRIYNASRGGKLEIFERLDFDSLFR